MCLTLGGIYSVKITWKNFIVAVLSLEFHLSARVKVFHVVLVLRHPLEHTEFHIYLALITNFKELAHEYPTLKILQVIILIDSKKTACNKKYGAYRK